ncbi:MAG: hypothetical protein HYS15_01095, partial [Candidatus Spechtbacteria bacterium]|nr:hypothetical protein [Candidatus Spechtbacteria bacterium]
RPEDLEGIENVIRIWHFGRYGRQQSHLRPQSRWQVFVAGIGMGPINDLNALEPFETYSVRVKTTDSPAYLGFGRFRQQVFPNMENLWIYQ